LQTMEMAAPFDFTKGVPVLKMQMSGEVGEAGLAILKNWEGGTGLYDLSTDPGQNTPLDDDATIARLSAEITRHLNDHHAPPEAYRRYGLEQTERQASVA